MPTPQSLRVSRYWWHRLCAKHHGHTVIIAPPWAIEKQHRAFCRRVSKLAFEHKSAILAN